MRTGLIIVILFLAAVFKIEVTCDLSKNDPTKGTESKDLPGKEETGDSNSFKPTHEWQNIKEGKFKYKTENIACIRVLIILAVARSYNRTDTH
jgi:hypothetical protein